MLNLIPEAFESGARLPEKVDAVIHKETTFAEAMGLTRTEAYGLAFTAHRLFEHGQVARATTGAARDAAIAAALDAGRDWRAMDPDNAGRERLLAELLLAVGQDDEAWRYLSSPIDRAPREGASFQGAAEVLERAGKLEPALGLWRRAFAIDATNPTWLQRQACLLYTSPSPRD